jgi:hypothetical protein
MKHWILLTVFATSALVILCGQGCVKEKERFATKVKSVTKPEELQTWATNLIATAKSINDESSVPVKQSDIPQWIGLIYKEEGDPGYVTVEGLESGVGNSNSFVQILYGGGFGHRGLAVGYTTLVLKNHDSCASLAWKPGIYFWECQ